jgi:phosphoglycolate phosphatase
MPGKCDSAGKVYYLPRMTSIIFDLDGTLIDTAPDLIATLNVILTREGFAPVALDEARNAIGAGAKPLLQRGLAKHGNAVSPARLDALYGEYLEYYAAHIADHSRPFPGLGAALDALEKDGFIFAVCTNKLEWLSVRLLDQLNLSQRFAAICGQDTFKIAKPNPEVLLRTIAKAGGDVSRTIMVGDSNTDILTARAAGIPVIAVDFGYTETPVTELSPDIVISSFDALPAAVKALSQQWR